MRITEWRFGEKRLTDKQFKVGERENKLGRDRWGLNENIPIGLCVSTLGSQLVALFGKLTESLGGGAGTNSPAKKQF